MLKTVKQTTLRSLKTAGVFSIAKHSRWRRERLLILGYHGISVADEHQWNSHQYMPAELLRARFQQLRDSDCEVLSLAEGIARLYADDLPNRAVVITFDDGMADFYSRAFPIIQEFQFPVTLYLTTFYSQFNRPVFDLMWGYLLWKARSETLDLRPLFGIDHKFDLESPDDQTAARSCLLTFATDRKFSAEEKDALLLKLATQLHVDYDALLAHRTMHNLTPAEVSELSANGVDVQLHTHRHRTPKDRALFVREIEDNRDAIYTMTGKRASHFCYPSGGYHPEFMAWLDECGVTSATTCEPGFAMSSSDRFLLPRLLDTSALTAIEFESWLTGVSAALPRRRLPKPSTFTTAS